MHCLTVLLWVSLFLNCDGTERTRRDILYDNTCLPTNCSQPARAYHGDNKFICGIGYQKDCELATTNRYGPKTDSPNIARLGCVHLYGRTHEDYKHGEYRALNLTIVLPNADEHALKTTMVALSFYSPYGPHMDEFYHKNSRCRLFYYHNSVLTKVDLEHPREIPYPCLVGLSESSVRHLYVVNLTVYPYDVSTAYHLVTYSYIGGKHCISASAIALLSPAQNIHVVFDTVQGSNWFRLLLLKDNEILQTVNNTNHNQYTFPLQGPGVYKVGIEHLQHELKICGTIFTDDIIIPEERTADSSDIFIIVGVICGALVLLIVLTVLIFTRSVPLSPSNIIMKLLPPCILYYVVSTNDIEELFENVVDDSEGVEEWHDDEEDIDLDLHISHVRYRD